MRFTTLRHKNDVSTKPRRRLDHSGQAVVLVSMVIMSFMMFFVFTLNTGLLINAKISVQAAADAAAYSGAATQARYLNAISFLNYDMRRQMKKLAFRNIFLGSMGSPKFPATSTGATTGRYDFPKYDYKSGTGGAMDALKVPIVCIPITPGGKANDSCTFINQRDAAYDVKKALGVTTSTSAISQALIDSMNQIQTTQEGLCKGQSNINLFVAIQWLLRGHDDPTKLQNDLNRMASNMDANDRTAILTMVEGLVSGLGIYPRNIISYLRIKALSTLINTPPIIGITKQQADTFKKEKDERSALAFNSARANLNENIFDTDQLTLDEMTSTKAIDLENQTPQSVNFNIYIQMMSNLGGAPTGVTCASSVFAFPAMNVPVGVIWPQANKAIAYGVRVHAVVRPHGLLFLPGSDSLELEAVAGAKPFGSRIGNESLNAQAEFTTNIPPEPVNGTTVDTSAAGPYTPNVSLIPGNNVDMLDTTYLAEMKSMAESGGAYTTDGIKDAVKHSMAPNLTEIGHYNILPAPVGSSNSPKTKDLYDLEFIPYSGTGDTRGAANSLRYYTFYAPLFAETGGVDYIQEIKNMKKMLFPSTSIGVNDFGISMSDLGDNLEIALNEYIATDLAKPTGGEGGESMTFASIELPLNNVKQPSKPYWLTKDEQVLSSWGPDYVRVEPNVIKFKPRFGFSVKFVALRDLLTAGISDPNGDLSEITH